jgi:hypothetical protein
MYEKTHQNILLQKIIKKNRKNAELSTLDAPLYGGHRTIEICYSLEKKNITSATH